MIFCVRQTFSCFNVEQDKINRSRFVCFHGNLNSSMRHWNRVRQVPLDCRQSTLKTLINQASIQCPSQPGGGRSSGKSNWASYNSQREKRNGKKQKTDSMAEEKTEAMHRKPSGRVVQRAVRAESPPPPRTRSSNRAQFLPSFRFEAPRHAI